MGIMANTFNFITQEEKIEIFRTRKEFSDWLTNQVEHVIVTQVEHLD